MSRKKALKSYTKKIDATPRRVTATVSEVQQDVFPQSLADALGLSFSAPKPLTAKQEKAEDAAFELLKTSDRYMVGTTEQVDETMEHVQRDALQAGVKTGLKMPRTPGELRVATAKPAISNVLQEVFVETQSAVRKHGPMHSPHEGLAVIMEEFDELKEEVYRDRGRMKCARTEAIQLAAMAVRYALDLDPR
jgi:hypothetical protein